MPTDVVGAMSAGGRLGLGRAQLGEQAREADQRAGLGYAQIGANQATAGAQLHAAQAQRALDFALHQSSLEEDRRRDEAVQRARSEALTEQTRKDTATEAETKRAHTAAEDLKKQAIETGLKRQEEIGKRRQIELAHRELLQAERQYHDAVKTNQGVDEAKKNAEDARRRYATLAGDYSGLPDAGTATELFTAPAATTLPAEFNLGMPPVGMNPMDLSAPIGGATSSGLKYSIQPVGE